MSLDVSLKTPGVIHAILKSGIFIRENGVTKEISEEEWAQRFPGRVPVVVNADSEDETVYTANVTHNLNKMAAEAGIYEALWRPEEVGITHAHHLIEPLKDGLALLQSEPERFKALNPENGWGDYDEFVQFVADYLSACLKHSEAEVSVWR